MNVSASHNQDFRLGPGKASLYFGALPPLIFACLIFVSYLVFPSGFMSRQVFEPPLLQPVLSTIFIFLVSCVVSYSAMRGYMIGGSLTILLMGSGVLALGMGAFLGGWAGVVFGSNLGVTIFSLSVLASSVFHLAGMADSLAKRPPQADPLLKRRTMVRAYLGVATLPCLVAVGSILGVIPPFFVQGAGPTPLRQTILVVALILFLMTASFMMRIFTEKRAHFFYWYSLALALLSISLACIVLQRAVGSPIEWLGRSAQYLSGIYFVVAMLSSSRDARAQGVVFDQAMAGLSTDSGIYWQDILDTVGEAIISCDHRGMILKWNPAAGDIFGYSSGEVRGTSMDHLLADEETRQALALPEGGTVEGMLRRKDASLFPAEISVSKSRSSSSRMTTFIIRDTSERKLAESRLHATMQRIFLILSNMNSAILLVTAEGRVEFVNQAFCENFGLEDEPADLVGLDSGEIITKIHDAYLHPEKDEARVREIIALGQPVHREEFVLKNGKTYLRDFIPLIIEGRSSGRLWIHFDITEQKRAEGKIYHHSLVSHGISRIFETALKSETEEELASACLEVIVSVTGSARGFIGELGPDGSLHALFGGGPGAGLLGRPGEPVIKTLYDHVLQEGRSFMTNDPCPDLEADGASNPPPALSAFLGVPLIHGGRTIGMIAVADRKDGYSMENQEDLESLGPVIVETLLRKRAEAEARVSYNKLRMFFDHRVGGIGITITNDRGDIRDANDFYLNMLGRTRDELAAGKVLWTEMTPQEWAHADAKCLSQLRASGICEGYEKEYVHADGSRVPVFITAVMMPESDDILTFVLDIIERKKVEDRILNYIDELKDANEELTRLNNAMVDRELRMIELKKEVNEHCRHAGRAAPYPLDFEEERP